MAVTGAIFQIQKNNARTSNSDGTYSATGQITVKGIRSGVAGHLTPEWQLFGGYSYLDARITQGTSTLPCAAVRPSASKRWFRMRYM